MCFHLNEPPAYSVDLDGRFSSEKSYHLHNDSLLWAGPERAGPPAASYLDGFPPPFLQSTPKTIDTLQNVNWYPPKCKLAPSNLQFLSRISQKSPLPNINFGGCQFEFRRQKLYWGCFIEKVGPPEGGGYLGFPHWFMLDSGYRYDHEGQFPVITVFSAPNYVDKAGWSISSRSTLATEQTYTRWFCFLNLTCFQASLFPFSASPKVSHKGVFTLIGWQPGSANTGLFFFLYFIGIAWPCYRGHLGPPGPKLEKESENEFPGPLGSGAQKVETGVEKESKSIVFQLFWHFFDSVFDFLGPGAERPRKLIFRLFFQPWARRAQMTPVAGKRFRKYFSHF